MTTKKGNFETLYEAKIPADKIEKKNGFDYLKWSYAWAEVKSASPTLRLRSTGSMLAILSTAFLSVWTRKALLT